MVPISTAARKGSRLAIKTLLSKANNRIKLNLFELAAELVGAVWPVDVIVAITPSLPFAGAVFATISVRTATIGMSSSEEALESPSRCSPFADRFLYRNSGCTSSRSLVPQEA